MSDHALAILNKRNAEMDKLRADLAAAQARIAELEAQCDTHRHNLMEYVAIAEERTRQISKARSDHEREAHDLGESFRAEIEQLRRERDDAVNAQASLDAGLRGAMKANTLLSDAMDALRSRISTLTAALRLIAELMYVGTDADRAQRYRSIARTALAEGKEEG